MILPRASSHAHSQSSAVGPISDRPTASRRRRGDFVFIVNPSGTLPLSLLLRLPDPRTKRPLPVQAQMAARASSGSSFSLTSAPASPTSAT
jgi:hypothetical protein